MNRVIAVTGVTGVLGRRVLERLVAAQPDDVSLRLIVRDSARAPRVHGVDTVVVASPGGYREGEGLWEASRARGIRTKVVACRPGATASTVTSSTALMRAVRGGSAHATARTVHTGRSFVGSLR